mmetsp:Transcript_49111/g.96282  ORF Transcript_49111/g.96282 Transcript_49111/m.96282 type:complete len:276 (-) Transcript_49111:358-1185(-)
MAENTTSPLSMRYILAPLSPSLNRTSPFAARDGSNASARHVRSYVDSLASSSMRDRNASRMFRTVSCCMRRMNLKEARERTRHLTFPFALTVALRGASYIRARSPKQSPTPFWSTLTSCSSSALYWYTSTLPSSNTKKVCPSSPSLMRQAPSPNVCDSMLLATLSLWVASKASKSREELTAFRVSALMSGLISTSVSMANLADSSFVAFTASAVTAMRRLSRTTFSRSRNSTLIRSSLNRASKRSLVRSQHCRPPAAARIVALRSEPCKRDCSPK